MLSAALIATALLAGVAGSWSPCGLSMIDTLDRRPVATATFAVGALAGGAATFGGLGLLGETLGAGGATAVAVAIAALLLAALGDAAGRRIVPQVRRQVPESWRRFLPLPLATALYGVLLGLGFTTFLLTFATWALAAACLAIGTPLTGVLVGLAFGAGRAVPVALLGLRDDGAALLGERPQVLRGLRVGVALALVAAATALLVSPPAARAASAFAPGASDPSASAGLVSYQPDEGPGVLVRDEERIALPGTHPAVSGRQVAWLSGRRIVVADAATLTPTATIPAPGADALALSPTHVAWRSDRRLLATAIDGAGPPTTVAVERGLQSLGRPSLDGSVVTYAQQSPRLSRIRSLDVNTGSERLLRSAAGALLLAPTRVADRLLFVRSTARRQQLVLGNRTVLATTPTARRDSGHEPGLTDHDEDYAPGKQPPTPARRPPAGFTQTLWTTALDGATAYVTALRHLRGGRTTSRILRVAL
ncbi:MAG: hypothetical protein WKF94_11920 [Solirubrobacteraceae bacterium]